MKKRVPILLGIILTFTAVWLLIAVNKSISEFIERLDNISYDLQLITRVLTHKNKFDSQVAIIDIDEKSLKAEGHWPWSRNKLAELVTQLQKQGASVIAFDIVFPEKEKNIAETLITELGKRKQLDNVVRSVLEKNKIYFDQDTAFSKSLIDNSIVLALAFTPQKNTVNALPPPAIILTKEEELQLDIIKQNGYISSIPVLQNAAKYAGFINVFHDNDGIIRRAPLLMEYKDGVYPSLALQAVMLFLGETISLNTQKYDREQELEGIHLGSQIIPTDAKGQALIPFIGRSYTFPYYSATDALHGKLPKDILLGKILFVGTSALGLGDLQPTSIQSPYPGVEIQATLANGLLKNNFSYTPAWTSGAKVVLTALVGLFSAIFFPYFGPRISGLIIVFLPIVLLFINNWVWEETGLVLSFIVPVILVTLIALLNILYGYLFESRRREDLKKMFGQYVPEKHIDQMLRTSSNYAIKGEDRNMSVLFADIRDFTTISEGLTAAQLVELLNDYLNPMTEIIFKNHGTIDKYIGDMIMAFWGAPLKDKNHEYHALNCALEMQKTLITINKVMAEHSRPDIKIGIGLNSGIMSVGDMGSRYRRNYTVLGDSVNLGSRIESLTKYYGVKIIASEDTCKNQNEFIFRQLDKVQVKGKLKGTYIYEVIAKKSQLTPELTKELATELKVYHQALEYYYKQQWDQAYQLMLTLSNQYPDKRIYQLYIERINEIKQMALPKDWDGMYIHVMK